MMLRGVVPGEGLRASLTRWPVLPGAELDPGHPSKDQISPLISIVWSRRGPTPIALTRAPEISSIVRM
jgi:hypothetical protein